MRVSSFLDHVTSFVSRFVTRSVSSQDRIAPRVTVGVCDGTSAFHDYSRILKFSAALEESVASGIGQRAAKAVSALGLRAGFLNTFARFQARNSGAGNRSGCCGGKIPRP